MPPSQKNFPKRIVQFINSMQEKEPTINNDKEKLFKPEIIVDGNLYVRAEFQPGIGIGNGIYELPEHKELIKKCEEENWSAKEYEEERQLIELKLLGAKDRMKTIELVSDTGKSKEGEWPIVENTFIDLHTTDKEEDVVIVYKSFQTKRGIKGSFNESHTWVLRMTGDEFMNSFLPEGLRKAGTLGKGDNIKYIDPHSSYLEYF